MSDAFATVTRDLPWLRAFAIRLARGDPDEADDLVQDALEAASQRAPPELESPRGWLATVLRNRLRMTRRGDARRTARQDAVAPEPSTQPEPIDELARIELLGFVMERLQALPETDRRIVTLRYFDELDATAIGERLAMPPATVRSRLQRTLGRLRADLDARAGGERRTWALVLGAPLPGRSATTTTFLGTITAMSTATKLGITTAAIAAATATWFVGRESPAPANATPSVARTDARTPTAGAPADRDEEVVRSWRARREAIREKLPRIPAPVLAVDESAIAAQANAAMTAAFEACVEDSDVRLQGRIVLRATMIGAPDTGTIFESITSVDPTTHDPALLECLVESSYAYTGPATAAPVEATTTLSFLGAQPAELDDDAWRQSMFDAVIVAHLAEAEACAGDAPVAGGVLLELDFAEGSTATAVRTQRDGVPPEVADCVGAAAATWKFPRRFEGRTMTHAIAFPIDAADE